MGHIIKPLSSNKNEIDKNVYKTKLSTFEKIGIMVGMMSLCGMIGGVLGGFLLEILENNLRILTGTLIGVGFGFVIGSIIILKYS